MKNVSTKLMVILLFLILLQEIEKNIGYNIDDIENGALVRAKGAGAMNQNLMYGRIKEDALEQIFEIMDLKESDIFIDLGHGIGAASLQASYTRGCEARGIEKMEGRFNVSTLLTSEIEIRKRVMREQDIEYKDVSWENEYLN